MRTAMLGVVLVVIGLCATPAATDALYLGGQIVRVADEKFGNIPAGAAVYIENVDAEFGVEFRSELTRQKLALKIVSTLEEAQYLIVGGANPDEVKLKKDSGALIMNVRRGGKVSVQDKAKTTTLWSGTWEVRSLNPDDLKKAASNLVGKLKKAIR